MASVNIILARTTSKLDMGIHLVRPMASVNIIHEIVIDFVQPI
jgi:hypothetical protein